MVHLLALRRAELHLSNQVRGRAGFHALRFLAWLRKLRVESEPRRGREQYGWREFGKETGKTGRRGPREGPAGASRSRTALEADGLHLLERRRLEFRRTRLGMVHLLALRGVGLHSVKSRPSRGQA